MAKGILIVEDSPVTQAILLKVLGDIGGEHVAVSTVKEAREQLKKHTFNLILLDVTLPDEDGLQFCSELRLDEKTKSTPVLFLSGHHEVTHKVTAFAMGADDYIEKPFNNLELRARVEAKIKKAATLKEESQILRPGPLFLDALKQQIHIVDESGKKTEVKLTPKEFKLLFHLASAEGRIFTREQLLTAVWGDTAEVFDRTVDSHISAIRRKLGKLSRCIESVPSQGYRFSATALSVAA